MGNTLPSVGGGELDALRSANVLREGGGFADWRFPRRRLHTLSSSAPRQLMDASPPRDGTPNDHHAPSKQAVLSFLHPQRLQAQTRFRRCVLICFVLTCIRSLFFQTSRRRRHPRIWPMPPLPIPPSCPLPLRSTSLSSAVQSPHSPPLSAQSQTRGPPRPRHPILPCQALASSLENP